MASRLSFCTRVLKYVILGNEKMTNYTYYSDRKKTKQSSLLNSKQLKWLQEHPTGGKHFTKNSF